MRNSKKKVIALHGRNLYLIDICLLKLNIVYLYIIKNLRTMKDLLKAIEIVRKFDIMNFDLCVSQFEEYTNQYIPSWIISRFKTIGLSNSDFLTSDFLNQYGFKNLLQFENDKEK